MNDEGYGSCAACGKEIVVRIDLSKGARQEYLQNCPGCHHSNLARIEVKSDGDVFVWVMAAPRDQRGPVSPTNNDGG